MPERDCTYIKLTNRIFPFFLVVFLTITGGEIFAQKDSLDSRRYIDSLKELLISQNESERVASLDQISRKLWVINTDSAFHYASLALKTAKENGDRELISDGLNSVANALYMMGHYKKAMELYKKSLDLRIKVKNHLKAGHSNHNMGQAFLQQKLFSEAISCFTEAAKHYRKAEAHNFTAIAYQIIASTYNRLNDKNKALEYSLKALGILQDNHITESLPEVYITIGIIHKELKNYELAEEYCWKAYKIWEELGDSLNLMVAINDLGIIFDQKGNQEMALQFYNKLLEYSRKVNDSYWIATALNNIGFSYIKIGQIDKGIDAYLQSLPIAKKNNDYNSYLNTCNNLASAYMKKGNLAASAHYLNIVRSNFNRLTDLSYIVETYELLGKLYATMGNFKKAYRYKTLQLQYYDSLYQTQQIKSITEMQTRFETENREKEIELLKKSNEIRQLELAKQRNIKNLLSLASILLLLIVVFVFYILYIYRKTNKILDQKNRDLEITNKKLMDSELHLQELNATKDKLFSIIAHDLKNPFNALIGFSDLLDKNYNFLSDEERKEYISIVNDSGQALFRLLDNLLQWARTQTGTMTYIQETINVLQIVQTEVSYLKTNYERKNININLEINDELTVYADRNSLATTIRNLLSNAIKFTEPGGNITIRGKIEDEHALISVSDSGIGINEDNFEKLFRLDGSFSTKGTANESGTGLGLLLCKEFIEKNNGRIWAESNKDKGTTFFFTLPLG